MITMLCDLSGKVALISGASSGIGAATAKLFAELGAHLALAGRNETNLMKVVDECNKHTKAVAVLGDLTIEDDVKRTMEQTIEHFGKLDILVNSAGILQMGTVETATMEQFDHAMNTNTRSIFHLTMLAVPYLIKQKGCIVNVSSVCGTRSFPGVTPYCTSKAAVDQMSDCIALDLAQKGVRVNCVNPGVIITEVHRRGGVSEEDYKKFLERTKITHPLGRAGDPIEVAYTIAFLAANESAFITGEHVHIDGGRHTACPR